MSGFRNWLIENKLSNSAFARRVTRRLESLGHVGRPVNPETVRRWALTPDDPAHRVPSGIYMTATVMETAGAVTPNDFYDLPVAASGSAGESAS